MKIKNFPEFTHFASIPFIRPQYRQSVRDLQAAVAHSFASHELGGTLNPNNPDLTHLTISMLTLNLQAAREAVRRIIAAMSEEIKAILQNTYFTFQELRYFTRFNPKNKKKEVSLLYLEPRKDEAWLKMERVTDVLIRALLKEEIVVSQELKSMHIRYDHNCGLFRNDQFHLTLFRSGDLHQDGKFSQFLGQVQSKMQPMVMQCDYFDVSTRFAKDETDFYTPLARVELRET